MRRSIWLLRRGGGPGTGGFDGDLDEDYVGRGFVDHDLIAFGQCESRSGCYARAAAPEQVGFDGDLDENCVGRGFVDHDWIAFGQYEGRSGCYAGAAASEQVVCVVAFVDLVRVGGGSLR